MRLNELEDLVGRHGLVVLGSHPCAGGLRVLIGNAGSGFWGRFIQSTEFSDGLANPLDRWSRRVGSELASRLGASVVFPFDGPPYPPFLEWASQSGQVAPSPITIHIHAEHGLWHAYRFALEFEQSALEVKPGREIPSPCDSCRQQPCLSACPVNAFEGGDYDVPKCMDYLRTHEDSDCRQLGCVARRACPERKDNQYSPDHAQFHMNAFIGQNL